MRPSIESRGPGRSAPDVASRSRSASPRSSSVTPRVLPRPSRFSRNPRGGLAIFFLAAPSFALSLSVVSLSSGGGGALLGRAPGRGGRGASSAVAASQKDSSRAAPTAIHSRGHLARIRRLTRSETGPAPLLAILQSIRLGTSFIAQQALLLSISLRPHARCRLPPKTRRLDSFQRRSDRLQLV